MTKAEVVYIDCCRLMRSLLDEDRPARRHEGVRR